MATWQGSALTTTLANDITTYKNITHQFNNYNEIFNLNVYVKNSTTQDRARLERVNDTLKSRVIKLKQEYIMQDREYKYMSFKNGLMYYTIVVTCIFLILVGLFMMEMISQGSLILITIILSVMFIISIVVVVKNNSTRRNLTWDQYYWEPMKRN